MDEDKVLAAIAVLQKDITEMKGTLGKVFEMAEAAGQGHVMAEPRITSVESLEPRVKRIETHLGLSGLPAE